jgi:osmotically-inducible protein OsmY
VDAGIATLRGDVKSHGERATAERVALHVYGVRAVANDIEVRLRDEQRRTDADIAQAVVSALGWNTIVPDDRSPSR